MKTCQGCGAPAANVHCGWCGREVSGDPELTPATTAHAAGACPRCSNGRPLTPTALAGHPLRACAACAGLWLSHASLTPLADAPRQPVSPGTATARPIPMDQVRYLRCPDCAAFMQRRNFEGISGVVLDTCAPHGVWLDAGELPALRAFVAGGGLERAAAAKVAEAERQAAHSRDLATPPSHVFCAPPLAREAGTWENSPLRDLLSVLGRVIS